MEAHFNHWLLLRLGVKRYLEAKTSNSIMAITLKLSIHKVFLEAITSKTSRYCEGHFWPPCISVAHEMPIGSEVFYECVAGLVLSA